MKHYQREGLVTHVEQPRPLVGKSKEILDYLTMGLADPAGPGISRRELGDPQSGAPTVVVERVGTNRAGTSVRYLVTRYIDHPSGDNTRVPDPEIRVIYRDGAWFAVTSSVVLKDDLSGVVDVSEVATAMLSDIVREYSLSIPTSPRTFNRKRGSTLTRSRKRGVT